MTRFNVSAFAVRHPALILFSILMIAAAGALSYLNLGRAEDPSFVIKVMNVSAFWPGATADEMQRLVADPIEKTLQEAPEFDRVRTYTAPGAAYLQLQLRDSADPAQVPDYWYQVRKRVGDMAASLPSGVLGPFFNDEFGDVDSALYTLTAEGAAPRALKDEAEAIRQRLLEIAAVEKVRFYGVEDEKIFVEFSHRKLATLGITPQAIFDSIARQNAVVASGAIDTAADRVALRVTGALDGPAALAAVPVEANGRSVRLGDIATIGRGYADPPSYLVRQQGREAVAIGVVMRKGENILSLGDALAAATAEIRADLPVGFELTQIADQAHVVSESVGEFLHVFVEALAIVLLVSFLSLGWRTGIVVALAVPLVLALVMVVMDLMGMSLERITLGALIIALGLLVDDAIIAVESMVVRMEEGWDRVSAAGYAWTATAFPMLTGTLVTAAGFLPVGFARSTTSEYAGGIFWVVAIALVASWIVAVVFTPYLGMKLLPDFAKRSEGRKAAAGHHADGLYETRPYRALRAAVRWCVGHRVAVTLVTVLLFAGSVYAFGFVQQQFFPSSTRPELTVDIRLPEGSSFKATEAAVARFEKTVAADPEILTSTAYLGGGAPRFFLTMNPELPKANYAVFVLQTADQQARERVKARLEHFVAEGGLPEARMRIARLALGPPVGFPVQFRVVGPDPATVRPIAEAVRGVMAGDPNLVDPNLDWNERVKSVRLVIDQERVRALGLTPAEIGQTLETLLSGHTVTEIRDGIERIGVVARAVAEERLDLDRLPDLTITSRDGRPIPLSQVARLDYGFEEPILWRQNRETFITARADVVPGIQPPVASAAVWQKLGAIRANLPMGARIEIGGDAEESGRANGAIAKVFPAMILVMLTLLMIQLQSFSRIALVLATAPLGLIGAAAALLVFDQPFGFVALLGVIALAGMIMRNTVILVDQIAREQASGADPFTAVVDAAIHRARPVLLTALAAILAMIPLSRNLFWGPMAFAIMGGLAVATVLTLLFVPALYALWYRIRPPVATAAGAERGAPRLLAGPQLAVPAE
ncbi:efflux RND transporter permease subunit [Prosthecomicrobium pneumaticum]|uniref:Multidrug efflux pump subunit AcrB n=1 Tax=Prosthecomicrobium pneumaticum TaxID=81895 RepID=A0A7W9FNY5_9HYPH|nr:efflux RND transporter permease subunit [Prosthecomicrobium pneumaticum]MBB5754125.1 multidrug efflux pump subunit AcrB [Prosthecomicrobium pneumaticum]